MTLTWNVTQMSAYPEKDGFTDVVFTVYWTLTATEENYNSSVSGSVGVELDPQSPYTPYADLTESQVIGWVQSALGAEQVAEYEAGVSSMIEVQKNPPVINPPLPWIPSAEIAPTEITPEEIVATPTE